ncbi:MAG: molecular chaperone TorD family protein [Bacillota bacterium]|nr:molecular chaperone TorD family protein [Bacillota bacterium]
MSMARKGLAEASRLKSRAGNRHLVYHMLSAAWKPPSDGLFHDLGSGLFAQSLELLLGGLYEAEGLQLSGLGEDFAALRPATAGPAVLRDELGAEYIRLFVANVHVPCPPYESAWRERPDQESFGQLWGGSTLDVLAAYREAGLEPAEGIDDVPDHLGMELEFMAHLAREESEGWRAADPDTARSFQERERRFLTGHLAVWVPDFCRAVRREADLPFYRGLARVTEAFILWERDSSLPAPAPPA